ncbi:MAG TPA: dihydroxyacetone kinase subunit L [Candidatus Agrococcus pullicola]|uniref:Dihydroxyacetone kinase subunit L n=1 Tax=Candidatus Agrococcus pullicola TaxID=2838429 RepID=A0A9D2C9M7_9MICO|nr:dihydroxyacetone kinase subunit L [Candidatus Agrococcus pullicola]
MSENALDGADVAAWMQRAARVVAEHESALTALDRAIGDGDHGANMQRGFTAVASKLESESDPGLPADVLKVVATTLISTVGGASGPLYGTAFLKGSIAIAGQESLDGLGLAAFLRAAAEGVQARGKAERGDKTMVDAWLPAAEAAELTASDGGTALEALTAAADAAHKGAAETEPLVAKKGRASYLGERAIGHRDPGAESTALLLSAGVQR